MKNIKFFVDANFAYHIHTFLKENCNKCIDWKAFTDFIKLYIKDTFNINSEQIALDGKYFTSTKSRTDDTERDFFYNSLDHANISKKATKLKSAGELGLKEDAVDVLLTVTAISDYYRARDEDRYSYFVLLAGDSDFQPLISELKSLGIKTIVVYLDCNLNGVVTRAGQALLEESDVIINLQALLSERVDEKIKSIFKEYPENASYNYSLSYNRIDNLENARDVSACISWNSIFSAMDTCRHYPQGFVLAAELGVKLQESLNLTALPKPLKEVLEEHAEKLDFIENPFKVRLKPSVYHRTR